MKGRIFAAILVLFFGSSFALVSSNPVVASAKTHHKSKSESDTHKAHLAALAAKKHKKALAEQHEARLAKKLAAKHKQSSKEKHLARLHELHLNQQAEAHGAKHKHVNAAQKAHLARLTAKQKHEERVAEIAAKKFLHSKAYRQHLARLAKQEHAHKAKVAHLVTQKMNAKADRLAAGAKAQRLSAVAEHNERLARRQAGLAEQADARRAKEARLLAAHNARLAAHNARLAAHYAREAQQEAWRREQQARIDLAAANGVVQWGTYAQDVPVQVILVDLNKPNIKVSALLARDGIGSSEPFGQMIERAHPAVAVTGTFFSLDNLKPVGDIVIDGNLTYFGGMGTALAITPNNRADMITVPWGRHHDWSGYECVVACGPRLLKDGDLWLDPHAERFHDSHMLSPNSRIAVGITPGNKLVFAMTRDRIYLGKLASVMKSLGCSQAMNLDAGTSTGFYCNGQMLARPGRQLTNAIVVHTDGRKQDTAQSRGTGSGKSGDEGG